MQSGTYDRTERRTDMNEIIVKRLANLCSVKSITTLVLTAVFAYLAISGKVSQEFMLIYTTVIAFYFGTQSQKLSDAVDGQATKEEK